MIEPIQRLQPIIREETTQKAAAPGGASFGEVFRAAIDNVKETDADRAKVEYQLATGQLDNPVPLMVSAAKNEIAVSLLVQLRNKAVEAYNEVMRISM